MTQIRNEILDLMGDESRWPKTEQEALEYSLLLQWIERDFFAVTNERPKITSRSLYLFKLRTACEAIRVELEVRHPQFESIKNYRLLLKTWRDLTEFGVEVVPGSNGIRSEKAPELVSSAITELVANHLNFSRGYPALSWVKNAVSLSVNLKDGPEDAGQQEAE
jgi:hypothetical protein